MSLPSLPFFKMREREREIGRKSGIQKENPMKDSLSEFTISFLSSRKL
jgi:hypothetical protein